MNSTKPHAFPGYDKIALDLENAAHIYKHFSAAYCQVLLETAETYAQQAQELPQVKAVCLELIGYLHTLPFRNGKEREARTALLERAERILTNGPDGSH